MTLLFGHAAIKKTGVHIRGDAIEVKFKGHPMGRTHAKLYLGTVCPEHSPVRQKKPVDPNASSIGVDIQSAIETNHVHRSSVRMEAQTAG